METYVVYIRKIYSKCNNKQRLQLRHFVDVFKECANKYNNAIEKNMKAIIDLKGEEIEALCFAVDRGYWSKGVNPVYRPEIGYDTPWGCLRLLENLSGIRIQYNPYLIESDDECKLNTWIEINNE